MRLFIKEHKWFIFLYILNFVVLLLLFEYLDDLSNTSILLYFIFLSVFFLFSLLTIKYVRSRGLYQLLSGTKKHEECDCGYTPLGQSINTLVLQYDKKIQDIDHSYKQQQAQNMMFVNRWIHYLKTPLSVLELICQDNEDSELIPSIQNETDKILYGLNMALNYARSNDISFDLHFETVNLDAMVKEVVHELKRWFIRSSVFPVENIDQSIDITTDVKWFKFILYQLLTNAIKYSEKKGAKVYISYHNGTLSVKDEGIGIPAKDISRIFEQFFTGENGRRKGESTGIGLYLVNHICEKLNYKINAKSIVGEGTTLKMRIQ